MNKKNTSENLWSTRSGAIALAIAISILLAFCFCLPYPLLNTPQSRVIEDENGELLSARIAADGQWRIPATDALPAPYIQSLIEFEDRRFYDHQGTDPFAFFRAIRQNLRHGKVVSGGSTITMQVIRLARNSKSRNLFQKLIEGIMAVRLELGTSKKKILQLYAANAPFGGNVVGLEAASWRYFAKSPNLLSWAEGALLAVLPNSPALMHPGRNRTLLLAKRNRLLDRLAAKGTIDVATCALAKEEPLPDAPYPLPRLAPHLILRAENDGAPPRLKSTLRSGLQRQVLDVVDRQQAVLSYNQIHNIAAIVVEVATGKVRAYVGNAPRAGSSYGGDVDIIAAPRSTGSIMKPLLYTLAVQEGLILPESLVPDVPMNISGYRPENFNLGYDGLVRANEALIRSLNIPFVDLLQHYDIGRFYYYLKKMGLSTLNSPSDHYGLSLILGGAEANLWDLVGIYASMARTLNTFTQYSSRYDPQDFHSLSYQLSNPLPPKDRQYLEKNAPLLNAGAIWSTFKAMQSLQRPESEGNWQQFGSSRQVAWKTGTSFGFRDAWAIGVTPEYVVGVWAGNADGEGRPGLIGGQVAAPILFEICAALPHTSWFRQPFDDMQATSVCQLSGFRAGTYCPTDTIWAPKGSQNAPTCPYHQLVHLDQSEQFLVNANCELPEKMIHRPWFVLPPLEEYYYRQRRPDYLSLPPLRADCQGAVVAAAGNRTMQLIYPREATKIYVPTDLDGKLSKTIFQVAHRKPKTTIYWHLDQEFLGETTTFHQFALQPPPGKHILTLVDKDGNRLEQKFEIIRKR